MLWKSEYAWRGVGGQGSGKMRFVWQVGFEGQKKVFFHPKIVAIVFLYYFKKYLEPMCSNLNWFSSKYERAVSWKIIFCNGKSDFSWQNCYLVQKVFFCCFFLVLFFCFVLFFFSFFKNCFYIISSSSFMMLEIWKSESCDTFHYFVRDRYN